MTIAVEAACEGMGFDKKLVKWSIYTYAKRNATFHKDLDHLISNGLFNELARALYHDLRDIYCVFSETRSQTDLEYVEYIVQTQIDRWFDTSDDPDNPQTWLATKALKDAFHKAKDKKASDHKAKEKQQSAQKVSEKEAKAKNFAVEMAARMVELEEAFARWTLKD
jgi:hypothetical protein